MDFFRSKNIEFDAVLNCFVSAESPEYVFLNFYNVAFDLHMFLHIWSKLIYHKLQFYFIFSTYSAFYKEYSLLKDIMLENFILIDYYYTCRGFGSANTLYYGFFTNRIFLEHYRLEYNKTIFVLLNQVFVRDLYMRFFVQYPLSNLNVLSKVYLPDFVLVFCGNNYIPAGVFELFTLDLLGLGIFDLRIQASNLKRFIYSVICGDLTYSMFCLLLRFLELGFITAKFLQYKDMFNGLLDTLAYKRFGNVSDLSFNVLYQSRFGLTSFAFYNDTLLLFLLLLFRQNIIQSKRVVFCNFYIYLRIYLYITALTFF